MDSCAMFQAHKEQKPGSTSLLSLGPGQPSSVLCPNQLGAKSPHTTLKGAGKISSLICQKDGSKHAAARGYMSEHTHVRWMCMHIRWITCVCQVMNIHVSAMITCQGEHICDNEHI